jgi:imidazolonepropionase-like amidohydrolase
MNDPVAHMPATVICGGPSVPWSKAGALRYWAALACCAWGALPLGAQMRPVAIQDATLLVGDGQTIEHGTVLFADGKITAAANDAQPSVLARKLAAQGKYVTPGLIDAGSSVGLRFLFGASSGTARAVDAFDRFAEDELRAAWRDGVTAVYLPARTSGGVGGVGAVVRLLLRGEPEEVVLRKEVALCAGLGLDDRPGPLARVRIETDLRRRFQLAKEYREAWEDYADSVKEYEEKLAERAKKPGAGSRPTTDPSQALDAKNAEAAKGGRNEELKKPPEPAKDRSAEMLLRVLDGELRLWVEANDPAEIAAVLDLAEEFNIAVVIEGATGAYLLAERLAAAQVPVVLSERPAPLGYVGGVDRYARPDDAAILHKAGVAIYFGSGRLEAPTAAPELALRAARAVGCGLDPDTALTALTAGAAKLLGVDKMVGRLKSGLRADLVVWSDHPFAPGAVVERVFIAGREVYRAEGRETEGGE